MGGPTDSSSAHLKQLSDLLLKIHTCDANSIFQTACQGAKALMPFKYSLASFFESRSASRRTFKIVSEDLPEESLRAYDQTYSAMDYMVWRDAQPVREVYRESDLFTERLIESSTIYKEWLEPLGMYYSMSGNCVQDGIIYGSIAIMRGRDLGNFTDDELELFSIINDHVSQRMGQLYPAGIGRSSLGESSSWLRTSFGLTSREIEIAELLAGGSERSVIAEQLSISQNTLKKHISNIYRKMGVSNEVAFLVAVNRGFEL
ncbi:LuxR C-terminal-related transcriptional regulator [Collinsella aerofaciens]|uniref:LuxR C-terminal-related transcriptional regulator n=2 Tax=Collinsella aerofaciens TaxID=74426 RepID=UPI0034A29640